MRILWLSHVVPYPPKAGVLLRAYYLMRGVAQEHELDLIAFIQQPLLETFYPTLAEALQECHEELAKICRSVTFLPIEKLQRPFGKPLTAAESLFNWGYMANWLRSSSAWNTIGNAARANSYDLAHFDCVSLACFRPLLGDTPTTLGHHNAESHMLLRRAEKESSVPRKLYFWQEGKRLAHYEHRVARKFVAHITCSELDTQRLRSTMPPATRFFTIPNGVDVEFFKPSGVAERASSLIFVSSMNWYPNVDAVLFLLREIWPQIRIKVPEATLDIVGAGAPKEVVDLAQSSPGATLHGFLPEIRPIMESAAIYICPIRDGGGTKLKVLDAFAMEKCVVAHPIACEGIDVTPGTNVVFAETPDDFANQVQALLLDPQRRKRIGEAARALAVRSYSFSAIGKNLTALLTQEAQRGEKNRTG